MSDLPVPRRGKAVYIIVAICLISALLQSVASLTIYHRSLRETLAMADNATLARIFLPLAISVCMHLGAGIAVYLMRPEALVFMGCLLARLLARMVDTPIHLTPMLDLSLLLALIYFTMRLFKQQGWRHPLTLLLVGLAAGHLTILLSNLSAYPMLVWNGSVSPLAALAALIGCGALYAAVVIMRSRPQRAKYFFLCAALAMGLSLPTWNHQYSFSTPFWSGVAIALLGFGLARHYQRH